MEIVIVVAIIFIVCVIWIYFDMKERNRIEFEWNDLTDDFHEDEESTKTDVEKVENTLSNDEHTVANTVTKL